MIQVKRKAKAMAAMAALPVLLSLTCCDRAGSLPALPLEVSAEIAGAHTRADINASNYDKKDRFENGDLIKIRKSTAEESTAITYIKKDNGWAPNVENSQLTTSGGEEFFASYPTEFSAILSDQTSYANFWKSNQLTSTATAKANRVDFTFAPAAARITIIVIYEADNKAVSATVTGSNVCTETGNTNELKLLCTDKELRRHTYTGIINLITPTASSPYTISVTTTVADKTETKTYTDKGNPAITFEAGYEYQYTFTTTTELILSSVTVKEFISTGEPTDIGSAT